MANYNAHAYDPESNTIRAAWWMDNYFGHYEYGVQFDVDGPVYRPKDVDIPLDGTIWVRDASDES